MKDEKTEEKMIDYVLFIQASHILIPQYFICFDFKLPDYVGPELIPEKKSSFSVITKKIG